MNTQFPLKVITVVLDIFGQNARILLDPKEKSATLIDPGSNIETILAMCEGYSITQVVITHAHIDHAAGVEELLDRLPAKPTFYAHLAEAGMRQSIQLQAQMYGLDTSVYRNVREPDIYLVEGDFLKIGLNEAKIFFTPGHSPGHIVLYFENAYYQLDSAPAVTGPFLIAGDTLFSGSIGRTDLPGGNTQTLMKSIEEKILSLPDATVVMSGHGPNTTVGHERRYNPFLQKLA